MYLQCQSKEPTVHVSVLHGRVLAEGDLLQGYCPFPVHSDTMNNNHLVSCQYVGRIEWLMLSYRCYDWKRSRRRTGTHLVTRCQTYMPLFSASLSGTNATNKALSVFTSYFAKHSTLYRQFHTLNAYMGYIYS